MRRQQRKGRLERNTRLAIQIGDTNLLRPGAILLVGRHCATGMNVRVGEMVTKPTFALAAGRVTALGRVPF